MVGKYWYSLSTLPHLPLKDVFSFIQQGKKGKGIKTNSNILLILPL